MNRLGTDMTQGRITVPLITFTIPLILGNLIQLSYHGADSVIVGKLIGENALAAVGTATPIMNIAILLISGICMGASVIMSTQYGAGDYELLTRQISTTMLAGCGFSLLFSILTIALAKPLLGLIRVPEEVIPVAASYLRIVFIGVIFNFLYNFLAGTMRAIGDSRTPLYFLTASAILNVLGDILFVAVFRWGVEGSAAATVLSEALCCLLCGIYIRKKVPLLCLGRKWLVFDKSLLGRTISYGSASAMQQVCLQVGKVIIQSVVNTQGITVMAAFTAVNRVDDFVYTPQQNIGHAISAFIAQNKGAGRTERIRKIFRSGILIELAYSVLLLFLIFFGASGIMKLFAESSDTEAVTLGIFYLRRISFMYLLPAFTNGIQGFFRGMGDFKITLYSTFMNMLGRVISVVLMIGVFSLGFASLAWANLIGWAVMLLFEVPLLTRSLRLAGK